MTQHVLLRIIVLFILTCRQSWHSTVTVNVIIHLLNTYTYHGSIVN